MFQADVANRPCRPTCERFLASLDRELGDIERQDQTTLRLCRALFTRADELGATYDELFASTAVALLEIAYASGHGVEDILAMIGPKLDEMSATPKTQAAVTEAPSLLGRANRKGEARVQSLLKALFGDTKSGSPSVFEVLHAAANALLLLVRDTGMPADATRDAVRRLANAAYAC